MLVYFLIFNLRCVVDASINNIRICVMYDRLTLVVVSECECEIRLK